MQVLSAFHLGRQGNSLSYMGKGVLRNATLCLRHVVQEMTSSVIQDNDWISPWIEGSDGQSRLEWLRSLWSYRDQEVRHMDNSATGSNVFNKLVMSKTSPQLK